MNTLRQREVICLINHITRIKKIKAKNREKRGEEREKKNNTGNRNTPICKGDKRTNQQKKLRKKIQKIRKNIKSSISRRETIISKNKKQQQQKYKQESTVLNAANYLNNIVKELFFGLTTYR